MNILILTPDRVGSTLLQRVLTVRMQFENYNKSVINLHELTNGIVKSLDGILSKPSGGPKNWTYFQTLPEIVNLLSSTDHYVTARLAKYHINNRKDTLQDQLLLYEYLNKNFYIISCNRTNLFEHAISWAFYAYTKKLNAFSHQEKQEIYEKLTANKLYIDPKVLTNHLDNYRKYENWVTSHFQVNATYNYEVDSQDLEGYCKKLNIFNNYNSWNQHYGISWNDFNRCHYIQSDTSNISLQLTNSSSATDGLLPLGATSTDLVTTKATGTNYVLEQQKFLEKNINNYNQTYNSIIEMADRGIVPNGIPIKLQTLLEKYSLIHNINECLDAYNEWATKNSVMTYTRVDLANQAISELKYWYDIA